MGFFEGRICMPMFKRTEFWTGIILAAVITVLILRYLL
jgi:hypothetical protein